MHNYVTDCMDNSHFPNVNFRSNSESFCYIWDGASRAVYIAARSHITLRQLAMDSNMKLQLHFLFFGVVLLSCVHVNSLELPCYCVEPDNGEVTGAKSCQKECSKCQNGSLAQFAANSSSLVWENNSVFYFLSGNHSLHEVFNVSSIENLTLIGYSGDNRPVVRCLPENNTHMGFLFTHILKLTISGLGFDHCGFPLYRHKNVFGALVLRWVHNLHVNSVEITHSKGWGLSCYEVHGNSLVINTSISYSHSISDYKGGNMNLYYYNTDQTQNTSSFFAVNNSKIINGCNGCRTKDNSSYKIYGGGIDVVINSTDRIHISLYNVSLTGNSADHGGNMAFTYVARQKVWYSSLTIEHCHFYNGRANYLGGGLYIYLSMMPTAVSSYSHNGGPVVKVTNSTFCSNSAEAVGAGVYIQLHENASLSVVANMLFRGCIFHGNVNVNISNNKTQERGGSAVNLINFHIPGYISHHILQYKVSFISCNFIENKVIPSQPESSVGSATLYVEENAYLLLKDCSFWNNNCTGITAVHSNIEFQGDITLKNNRGYNGGGMVLCANSVMFLNLSNEINVYIENCHATNFGGGIYAEFECTQAIPPCFFQVSNSKEIAKSLIHLTNNTAEKAGTAIYGGAVDYCYTYGPYNKDNKSAVFNALFHIIPSQKNSRSNISSNPTSVCFCHNNVPNCINRTWYHNGIVYPGSKLSVSVVIVGQRNGIVPGIVKATPYGQVSPNTSEIHQSCTTLNYTITSPPGGNRIINLIVEDSDFKNAVINPLSPASIKINVVKCPPGFSLNKKNRCICSKWIRKWTNTFKDPLIYCTIENGSIHRNSNSTWWLGFSNNSNSNSTLILKLNQYCPFNYCVRNSVKINATTQDHQCANNRSGTLCGGCKVNLSNVFGSNVCKPCQEYSILVAFGLTALFAILGIVLILLLGFLNLTVSEGTLNAIIFYMNVVRVNNAIFFDFPKDNLTITIWLKMFTAWMNLDLGIETCFYNGMGAIGKTALQFVFPFYMWFLAGVIIYFSKNSSLITKLVGKNAVKILATIIFLFYAKIIQIVIDIVRLSTIVSDNSETTYVWSVDGNISYQETRHSILLVFAITVAAVTLPYTLALLFIQCLRKRSEMRVLFWVNKLKPFFDSYTGPYKDKYHFWTGFLLIFRIMLFVGIATNVTKGPPLNFTMIATTVSLLVLFIQPGIYKKRSLNIIETFTYTNLLIFVALSAYDMNFNYTNNKPIILCIGSMFLLFCGVVIYHVCMKISDTQWWGKMKVWLLDKRWPWMKRKPIRSLILNNSGIDELSGSDNELDPILADAPPVVRYDEYREPLVETGEGT